MARLVLLGLGARAQDEGAAGAMPSGTAPGSAAPGSGDSTEIVIDAHEASALRLDMEGWCAAGLRCGASTWARLAQRVLALSERGHDRRGRRVADRPHCGSRHLLRAGSRGAAVKTQ